MTACQFKSLKTADRVNLVADQVLSQHNFAPGWDDLQGVIAKLQSLDFHKFHEYGEKSPRFTDAK